MCGIAGKVNFSQDPIDKTVIQRMCRLLTHRGPDDEGLYVNGRVGLGMRRLSIVDIAGGHQPLSNEDGTIWIVFNGEIYNYAELRSWLEAKGHVFGTRTDTEAIVHLYEELGERCVTRLNGMFAFAIWDSKQGKLLAARDRLGKKPLHYAITKSGITFASEIAPILEDPSVQRRLDLTALQQYLKLWYVPSPLTMFEGINKLPAGHILICANGKVNTRRYWDVDFSQKLDLSEEQWSERFLDLIDDSVRIRLMGEVPVGAFLSGGLDSSTVAALMSKHTDKPIKTFSIGFDDEQFNELVYARQVAKHLNTEHFDEIVRPDAVNTLQKLIWHYGQPFGDESCIPTYYVSCLARQHVTVALSGDGGDENFGGYPRLSRYSAFNPFDSIWGLIAGETRNHLFYHGQQNRFNPGQRGFWKELAFRFDEIINPLERYTHEWLVWKDGVTGLLTPDAAMNAGSQEVMAPLAAIWQRTKGWKLLDRLLYLELMTYLPDDLQVKIDIASMATSLEVRSPLLDYRIVELAASMPAGQKFRDGQTKHLFRQMVKPLMPTTISQRSKWGFSMPIGDWLRNELRPMVEDLILGTLCRREIFRADKVRKMVAFHMTGQYDCSRHLWLLLVFELWYQTFFDRYALANSHRSDVGL